MSLVNDVLLSLVLVLVELLLLLLVLLLQALQLLLLEEKQLLLLLVLVVLAEATMSLLDKGADALAASIAAAPAGGAVRGQDGCGHPGARIAMWRRQWWWCLQLSGYPGWHTHRFNTHWRLGSWLLLQLGKVLGLHSFGQSPGRLPASSAFR